jgi:hypothetical protein
MHYIGISGEEGHSNGTLILLIIYTQHKPRNAPKVSIMQR